MSESSQRECLASNFERGRNAPKKINIPKERISFRDLATFAVPRKTKDFLVERLGCDDSTAKRWLRGTVRAPDAAVYAVCAEIFTRLR